MAFILKVKLAILGLTVAHNGMVRSQDLFWWKWLTGQAMAALNYKLILRVMEQSGADQNGMGGIPTC